MSHITKADFFNACPVQGPSQPIRIKGKEASLSQILFDARSVIKQADRNERKRLYAIVEDAYKLSNRSECCVAKILILIQNIFAGRGFNTESSLYTKIKDMRKAEPKSSQSKKQSGQKGDSGRDTGKKEEPSPNLAQDKPNSQEKKSAGKATQDKIGFGRSNPTPDQGDSNEAKSVLTPLSSNTQAPAQPVVIANDQIPPASKPWPFDRDRPFTESFKKDFINKIVPLDAAKIRDLAAKGQEPFASFARSYREEIVVFAFEKLSSDQCAGLIHGLFGLGSWVHGLPDNWAFVHCLTGIYNIQDPAKRAALVDELILLDSQGHLSRYVNTWKYSDPSNTQRKAAFTAFPKDYLNLALNISDGKIAESLLSTIAKAEFFLLDLTIKDMDLNALPDAARLRFLTWAKTVRPRFNETLKAQNLAYPLDPVKIDTTDLLGKLDELSVSDCDAIAQLFKIVKTDREYMKLLEDFEKTKPITGERFHKFLIAVSRINLPGNVKYTPILERLTCVDLQDFFSKPMMANIFNLATADHTTNQADLLEEYVVVHSFLGDYLAYAFGEADELYGKALFSYFFQGQPKLCEAILQEVYGKNLEKMPQHAKERCEAWAPAFLKRAEYRALLNRLDKLDVDRQTIHVNTHFENISGDQFEELLGEFLNLPSKPYDLFKKFLLATYYIQGMDKDSRYAALIRGLDASTLREYFASMNTAYLLKFNPDDDDCYKSPDWVVHAFLSIYVRFAFKQNDASKRLNLLHLFHDKQTELFLRC